MESALAVYKSGPLGDTLIYFQKVGSMQRPKNRQEARLQDLIVSAKQLNIHVRTEKLLREAGYRTHSGRCRVKGQELIVIDRDISLVDQIEFLTNELAGRQAEPTPKPAPLADQSPDQTSSN